MSTIQPSQRARSITDSITLAIAARAQAMRADGVDVVSLGAGEPDFGTPGPIADAGVEAIRSGKTRYTAAAGTPELRAAAAEWFGRRFGLDFGPRQVLVTAGAKPALMLGLNTLVERGDRVLLPAPYWPSYPDLVRLADGVPVDIAPVPERAFVHDGDEIAAAAREHGARGVVINYPNNPSGAVPTRDQMASIVDAIVAEDLWLISDEIYGRLLYDGLEHVSPASFAAARERVLVVNGGTKSHSMTGWRIGFLAGPEELVAAAGRIQSQALGNPCSISQEAALAMCRERDDSELNRRLAEFDTRRRYVATAANAIDGLRVELPRGAFYALVDVRAVCATRGVDDIGLAEQLLVEARVATVPGTAFAIPGFIRVSYAASMADLERAFERIRAFVQR